jgi:TctA family transporter
VIEALGEVLDPGVLLVVVLSAFYGVLIGAIPGLTATMAVALIVPLTFHLDPVHAIAAVVTLVACAIFAGDIPSALVRMPGTPASAAYTDDLHALAKQGQQDRVLGVCLVSSVVGGLLGSVLLILFAQSLARVTALFGTVEYFWLYLLGLGCGVVATRGSALRGALGLVVGLGLSTVGLSTAHGSERLTFGLEELYRGISFIPAMIGLFGLSEVLRNLVARRGLVEGGILPGQGEERGIRGALRSVFGLAVSTLRRRKVALVRSAGIGAAVGMLPGAGADIAAWPARSGDGGREGGRPRGRGRCHGRQQQRARRGLGADTRARDTRRLRDRGGHRHPHDEGRHPRPRHLRGGRARPRDLSALSPELGTSAENTMKI